MGREDVDLVRRGLRVFEAEGLDAWLEELVAPDAEYVQDSSVGPEAQTWSGHDGWRAGVNDWTAEWKDWQVSFGDLVDLGRGRVAVPWSDSGVGRSSGIKVERRGVFVHTIRDGKIVRTVQHGDVDVDQLRDG